MPTPFVKLQTSIISCLQRLKESNSPEIKYLAKRYCVAEPPSLTFKDFRILTKVGFTYDEQLGEEVFTKLCGEILRDQIDNSGPEIVIRNLLGMPFSQVYLMGYKEYIADRGSGHNFLRTYRFAQPSVLKKGDTLANGDSLLSDPREGGNGSVLLHLTGGMEGHWVGVPARIPIALLTTEDGAPPELVEVN